MGTPIHSINSNRTATVLCVSPIAEDHRSLAHILSHPEWPSHTDCNWKLCSSTTPRSALAELARSSDIAVVICERRQAPGTWRDLLLELSRLPHAPFLVVASRLADERLWAEALNEGAYDVLAKPFRLEEVGRTLSAARRHWSERRKALTA